MTAALGAMRIAAVRDRVRTRLVGREHELDVVLAAVDIVLEGPPGTSKSTLLRGITAEWGIPLVFVEGNAVEQVHGEDGCELYALHRDDDRLVMIERWASPAALQTHSTASPALQKLNADLDGKLAAPLDVVVLEPVLGGDLAKGQL